MKSLKDVEFTLSELGDTPVKAPRKRFWDYLPARILGFTRTLKRRPFPDATPYEEWLVRSVFLRIFFTQFLVERSIEDTPKPFFTSTTTDKGKTIKPEDRN